MLRNKDRLFGFVQISQYFGCLPLKCGYKFYSHKSDTILSLSTFQGNVENRLGQLNIRLSPYNAKLSGSVTRRFFAFFAKKMPCYGIRLERFVIFSLCTADSNNSTIALFFQTMPISDSGWILPLYIPSK